MGKRITMIIGHPDGTEAHFCHALARAYEEAAAVAGHEVRTVDVGRIDFPLVRTRQEFEHGTLPAAIADAQEKVRWAEHLFIVYPLWLGTFPALLKGFFEQTFRYGFALDNRERGFPKKLLRGRSARIVVTMGMPSAVYRFAFRSHGLKSLKSGILSLSGIRPIRSTLVGSVESRGDASRARVLERMRVLGRQAR